MIENANSRTLITHDLASNDGNGGRAREGEKTLIMSDHRVGDAGVIGVLSAYILLLLVGVLIEWDLPTTGGGLLAGGYIVSRDGGRTGMAVECDASTWARMGTTADYDASTGARR